MLVLDDTSLTHFFKHLHSDWKSGKWSGEGGVASGLMIQSRRLVGVWRRLVCCLLLFQSGWIIECFLEIYIQRDMGLHPGLLITLFCSSQWYPYKPQIQNHKCTWSSPTHKHTHTHPCSLGAAATTIVENWVASYLLHMSFIAAWM